MVEEIKKHALFSFVLQGYNEIKYHTTIKSNMNEIECIQYINAYQSHYNNIYNYYALLYFKPINDTEYNELGNHVEGLMDYREEWLKIHK
ncbi:hypothetical protein [Acidithiobacillus sp.]|uniref:hypothetical protein n=1 Tax=Acidithiobacillus sp. TaxID=1872118 RepID=UPI00356A0658